MTAAHGQRIANTYEIFYPAHPAREDDPHYKDFHHYHEATKHDPTIYRCTWAAAIGDFGHCSTGPLELHHSHIEFALQAGIDLAHLEHVYPGVGDPSQVGAWIESAQNLAWYCARHHRSAAAGIHHLSASDFEGSKFLIAGIIGEAK